MFSIFFNLFLFRNMFILSCADVAAKAAERIMYRHVTTCAWPHKFNHKRKLRITILFIGFLGLKWL